MSTAKRWMLWVGAVGALTCAGCDDPPTKSAAPTKARTAATAKKPAEASSARAAVKPVELTDEDVPVAEDYVDKATEEIDDSNYEAKLAEIQKEVEGGD